MRKVIFADTDKGFINDIQTKLMLEDYDIAQMTARDVYEVYNLMESAPDAVVVAGLGILQQDGFNISKFQGRELYCYAVNGNDVPVIQSTGAKCMGVIKNTDKLLELVCMPVIPAMEPVAPARKSYPPVPGFPKQTQAAPAAPPAQPAMGGSPAMGAQRIDFPQPQQPQYQQYQPQMTQPVASQYTQVYQQPSVQQPMPSPQGNASMTPEQFNAMMQMMQTMMGGQSMPGSAQMGANQMIQNQEYGNGLNSSINFSEDDFARPNLRDKMNKRANRIADEYLAEDDVYNEPQSQLQSQKATVLSVYSSKGGVGKTSIACETAAYLALTSNGRRKFRVCIVDYDVDFGDVVSILNFDERGANMVSWAAEIQRMIQQGTDPGEISFSRQQMEDSFLQLRDDIGIYGLIAPIAHEDSMSITADALEVMLRNIVENGGFDYVVCDTGNNTRDASIIAIDAADYVLLVGTQDITTANCNSAVIRTLQKTGFNTDKFHLVINNIIPAREAGNISVQEIEETFPYPCICRIKHMPDVTKANNNGRPLVLIPNHEYTKQVQRIVNFVTSGIQAPEEEPKRGLFRKRSKRG